MPGWVDRENGEAEAQRGGGQSRQVDTAVPVDGEGEGGAGEVSGELERRIEKLREYGITSLETVETIHLVEQWLEEMWREFPDHINSPYETEFTHMFDLDEVMEWVEEVEG